MHTKAQCTILHTIPSYRTTRKKTTIRDLDIWDKTGTKFLDLNMPAGITQRKTRVLDPGQGDLMLYSKIRESEPS